MKRGKKTLVCLVGCLLLSLGAKAVVTDAKNHPYHVIIERNVFAINPPPTINTTPPPPPPATEVKLAGITTIISPKRAILQWKEPAQPATPGKPAAPPGKEQSFIMVEGQREGIIEVLEINEKAGSVRIKNAGEPMLITFETHGVKLPNTPVPTAPPGALPGALPNPAGGAVPRNLNASFNPGAPAYNQPGGHNPTPAVGGINTASSGLTSIPTRQLRSAPDLATTVAQQPPMTPETQIVLMEIERERTKDAVAAGELPPLPPTELTPVPPAGP